ncbi:hypothetical protein DFH09DRAFT_1163743 [Mycena vulgaris]|nr:hypothetical protein DFH09DRAFT_1163743 [Mycena vulgaris]
MHDSYITYILPRDCGAAVLLLLLSSKPGHARTSSRHRRADSSTGTMTPLEPSPVQLACRDPRISLLSEMYTSNTENGNKSIS